MNDMSRRVLPPQGMEPDEPERPRHGRGGPFGVLDIGTTKIVCLIGRSESDGTLRVLGFGWHRGKGVRGGGIVDLDEAERAIRAAVGQAEDMADMRLRAVTVNLTCGQPASRLFNVQWPIGSAGAGRAVEDADIRRIVAEGRARADEDGRETIHALPAHLLRRRHRPCRRSARLVLHHADRAAAHHRRGNHRIALAGRLHWPLRPGHRRAGLRPHGRRLGRTGGR